MYHATNVTGVVLHTASMGRAANKTALLRTAFKSEMPNTPYGEIESLLNKTSDQNVAIGYKSLPKPLGMPAFGTDLFRKTARVWQLPANTKLPNGVVALNVEPGFWMISPEADMDLLKYKTLLEESNWTRLAFETRVDGEAFFGEGKGKGTDRTGLAIVDHFIISAMETYIKHCFRLVGMTPYDEAKSHIDNDIARVRGYLRNYRGDAKELDSFVASGALVKVASAKQTVFRPTSTLFYSILKKEIAKCEKVAAKEDTNKSLSGRLTSAATALKEIIQENGKSS
jgi:hypothetical protein